MSEQPPTAESDASPMDDFEFTLTRKALRQIKAEAWDAGARKASPHAGAYLRSFDAENPYRDFSPGGGSDA